MLGLLMGIIEGECPYGKGTLLKRKRFNKPPLIINYTWLRVCVCVCVRALSAHCAVWLFFKPRAILLYDGIE